MFTGALESAAIHPDPFPWSRAAGRHATFPEMCASHLPSPDRPDRVKRDSRLFRTAPSIGCSSTAKPCGPTMPAQHEQRHRSRARFRRAPRREGQQRGVRAAAAHIQLRRFIALLGDASQHRRGEQRPTLRRTTSRAALPVPAAMRPRVSRTTGSLASCSRLLRAVGRRHLRPHLIAARPPAPAHPPRSAAASRRCAAWLISGRPPPAPSRP